MSAASKSTINFAEDDEFKEFDTDDWKPEKVNASELWEEDWDKDGGADEFSQQLRAELDKARQQLPAQGAQQS
eukprot:jgi/Tetstr1/448298/TSEL_035584.t1